MSEYTITLHTFYGLNADTAAYLGLVLLIVMGLSGILLVACAGFRQRHEWVAVGWSLLVSGLVLGGAFLGLSFTLHKEDVTGVTFSPACGGGGFLLKNPDGPSFNRLSPHALWFAWF